MLVRMTRNMHAMKEISGVPQHRQLVEDVEAAAAGPRSRGTLDTIQVEPPLNWNFVPLPFLHDVHAHLCGSAVVIAINLSVGFAIFNADHNTRGRCTVRTEGTKSVCTIVITTALINLSDSL